MVIKAKWNNKMNTNKLKWKVKINWTKVKIMASLPWVACKEGLDSWEWGLHPLWHLPASWPSPAANPRSGKSPVDPQNRRWAVWHPVGRFWRLWALERLKHRCQEPSLYPRHSIVAPGSENSLELYKIRVVKLLVKCLCCWHAVAREKNMAPEAI